MATTGQQYIVKFPLEFAADGKATSTSDPRGQFSVFLNCPIYNRLVDPNYGLEEKMLLQKNIFSIQELSQLYMITMRDKFRLYLRNINITRVTAKFDRTTRNIDMTI